MSAGSFLVLASPTVAVLIAMWGFRRSSRADRLAAFFRLHDQYLRPEIRAGRQLIHERIAGRTPEEMRGLSADDRASVGYTLAVMNSIAIACEARYVDLDVVDRSMGRSFRATMRAATPFIDHLEERRGFRPYGYAERLPVGENRASTSRIRWWLRRRPSLTAAENPEPDRAASV
ncbi:DUF4760 domain-containing protein [Actinoplanes regularis]|uniref:DUF4760 domain-containing protein n=1 Tax=Actinoplanes regularis TaxID=52697 RepID=UPI0024A56322|nr:hypothetical protein [Actinoplanes regularis]GLW29815.1 hypothetical protein Areg01_27550 [Actinoplanes regularis]